MRPYEYRCKDYSLLTPLFKKVFVSPVINYLPWGLPANIITILSNMLVYLAFFLSIKKELLGDYNYIIIPVLLFGYLVGDHLDGAQAKRTRTGSALGEFCDHYLDAFNNGLILYMLFSLFDITTSWLVAGVLFFSYIAHTIVFYEQFRTGWLIFEKLGSLEGVLLSCFLIGLAFIPDIRLLYQTPMTFGISFFGWILLITAFGGFLTFTKTVNRLGKTGTSLWLFIMALLFVCLFGSLMMSVLELSVLVTLYASLYLGRLMTGHLVDGIERHTDPLVPLVLPVAYFGINVHSHYVFAVVSSYLLLIIILLIYRTFNSLKQFWVWKNPPVHEKG